jgi:hypothetical protein
MPKFANWLVSRRVVDEEARAIAAWARIQEKPSTLTVVRVTPVTNVRTTHEVVVRVEYDNESDEYATVGNMGVNQMGEAVLFGVRNHPTEEDTNLQRGDTFFYAGANFRVVMIIPTIGELQFLAEVQR